MENNPTLVLHGSKILTQLRILLEEACVWCFNLLKPIGAKGKETRPKAPKHRNFFCIPGVASTASTDQPVSQVWLLWLPQTNL